MSSPSDNDKSKHTDEESLSDKESFNDEQNVDKKDRKKKRKSKELLKSPSKVAEQMKASPGTSKKKGSNLVVGDTDSSSGEKHVGVVGDNIKHLNLNEGDKLTEPSQKDGLKSTEVRAEIGSPLPLPDPIAEASLCINNPIVQQLPANEQGSLINEITASTSNEVRGEVPNNSLNEPGDSLELKADLHQLPSTSMAYRRKTYAQKADDTLDDVSEIVSDFTDIPSDSSSGQVPVQSGRRSSQETSSDAKAEGLSESLESESKVAPQQSEDLPSCDKLSDNKEKNSKDNGVEEKFDDQKISVDVLEKQHCKPRIEEHGLASVKVVDPHGSNEKSNTQKTNENNENDKEFESQHSEKQECGQDGVSTSEQNQAIEEQRSAGEEVVDQDMEEAMDEQDGSVQDDSDNDVNESFPAESIEDPDMEQYDMDEESREINQSDNQVVEEENSSEQGGLNNGGEQESSSDYQNFARGQYARFPIDSTTTDSGIENSLSVFGGNYVVPDNSESNEGSALGSSAAAGFQNLQNWVERGVAGAPSQSNEGLPGPSNVTEQGGPSTSYASVLSNKILKVAVLETIEDVPMECAEQFAESPSEGSILEVMPDSNVKGVEQVKDESEKLTIACGQRPGTSGTILGVENENVIYGSTRSSNEPIITLTRSVQESNPDEENNSLHGEETAANNNQVLSLDPKTSQRLARGDSEQLSSSSQEQSRESSLADMDDAVDSNDSLSKEVEPQQTAASLLQTLGVAGASLCKDSGSKPQRSKRRARKFSENNSPFKKRKDTAITCGQQARAVVESLRRKPDSDDDSSKDDRKF